MALEGSFQQLTSQLCELQEMLLSLRTTTCEDKPIGDDAVLVDLLSDATDDLLGWIQGALLAAEEARQAVQYPVNMQRTWRALTNCQQRVNHIQQQFNNEFVCYERIAELTDLADRRQGEWLAWSGSVIKALQDCRHPLYGVGESIFVCWQEVGQQIGMQSVTVQAMNFVQQGV